MNKTTARTKSPTDSTDRLEASIYDFPKYYDFIFGSDWAAEVGFLKEVFNAYADGKVKRLFEPACGTGRLMFRLSRDSFHCDGNDLNPKAVEYCNERMKRFDLPGRAATEDMSDFSVKKPYDAAFNTINSFRHLLSEKSARLHLECMADAIRVGGLYALGLHLTPTEGIPADSESFTARKGHLQVNTSMWPKSKDTKKRIEEFHMRFDIYTPTSNQTIDDVLVLRSYTYRQMAKLLSSVPKWQVCEVFDFAYNIHEPVEVDAASQDVIYILKRTA